MVVTGNTHVKQPDAILAAIAGKFCQAELIEGNHTSGLKPRPDNTMLRPSAVDHTCASNMPVALADALHAGVGQMKHRGKGMPEVEALPALRSPEPLWMRRSKPSRRSKGVSTPCFPKHTALRACYCPNRFARVLLFSTQRARQPVTHISRRQSRYRALWLRLLRLLKSLF